MNKWMTLGLAVIAFAVAGCGGGNVTSTGGGQTSSQVFVGTQQPGDVWQWELGTSTFTASNETRSFNYAGAVELLPSGFSKLTMASSNDDQVPVDSVAYAVEIPGTCLLVKPADTDGAAPVIATAVGANPTANTFSMNWVTVPSATFTMQDDAFGIANFTKTETGYDLAIDYGRLDHTGPLNQGMGTTLLEQDGRYVVQDVNVVFGLQRSGVFVGDKGPDMGGIIGMQVPTTPITWSDVTTKSYIGMLVRRGRTQLVAAHTGTDPQTLAGSALASESEIASGVSTDPERGVVLSHNADFSNGLFKVDLTSTDPGSQPEVLYFIVGEVDGKFVVFGFGGNDSDGTYNLLLVEN
ncbi:MAG: hypothetical protein JST40_12895 [Armatimonadetes bacterium]|nr:hypothetical protein [Armatimonadota bacterium]